MKKPWQKMTEGEQKLEIERATDRATQLVDDIVDVVATGDFPVVHAIIDNYTSKNGEVKIVAKGVASDDVILNLHHAAQKPVKIVVADRNQFDQSRSNVPVDPDEPGLPGVKQEIQPEELRGGFDDADEDEKPEVDEPAPFDDAEEQAEGDQVLQAVEYSQQWHGGYNSRMHGFRNDQNPFEADTTEAADWHKGWHSADGREDAPEVNAEAPEVESDAVDADETSGELNVVDPDTGQVGDDIELPEESAPLGTPQPGLTDDQKDDLINAGVKARKNGQAPKTTPYGKGTEQHALWLEGYNAEKKAEAERDKGGDAAFDD